MKNLIKSLLLVTALVVVTGGDANAYVDKQTAVVRIMNKAAGKVQTVSLPVGLPQTYEKLTLLVQSCKQTDPFDAQDYFMFVEINKSDQGKIFSGWMSANDPGNNPLQNADYDVWLVSCE